MAGTNQYLPIATAAGALVLSYQQWLANTSRQAGFQIGEMDPEPFNTMHRQHSVVMSAVAQLIPDFANVDAVDDGNVPGFEANLRTALAAMLAGTLVGKDVSQVPNLLTVALSPAPPALNQTFPLYIRPNNTNTGASQININGLGLKPLVRRDLSPLQAGDIVQGRYVHALYDKDNDVVSLTGSSASDTINQIYAAPARMILAKGTAQTVASGVATDITSYTTVANNLPASNITNGVITIGVGDAGVYLVTASFRFSGNAQAYNIFAGVSLNGGALVFNQAFNSGNGDVYGGIFTTAFERLSAGDQLKVNINQVNASSAARGFSAMTFGLMRIGA